MRVVITLFNRLEFNAVLWQSNFRCQDANLMYMTSFSNQESRDAHWKAFLALAEWEELIDTEDTRIIYGY
jgi:hypothetical protein